MDWVAIGPILGLIAAGGGIAAVAGAIGALYQSRKEHTRWLRDLRLQRFEAFASSANAVVIAVGQEQEATTAIMKLQAAESTVSLVGPYSVYFLAKTVADLAVGFEKDPDLIYPYQEWASKFNAEARRVLNMPETAPFSTGRL